MAQTDGLSAQDKADLAAIRKQLPAGDPRAAKIDTLIGPDTDSMSENPNREGTYKMVGPQGQSVSVPFSKVRGAQDQHFAVADTDQSRYQKDAKITGNAFTSPNGFLPTVRANYADSVRPSNAGDGGIVSRIAHDFGRGAAAAAATPIIHPLDTLQGLGSTAKTLATEGVGGLTSQAIGGAVKDFRDNGATKAIPNLLGQAVGGTVAGEVAGPVIGAVTRNVALPAIRAVGTAAKFASATPESLNLAATRVLAPGTPGEVLTKALKPGVKYGGTPETMLDSTLPAIMAQGPIDGVADYAANADDAKAANNSTYQAQLAPYKPTPQGFQGTAPRPATIDGYKFVGAQAESVPSFRTFENPDLPADTARAAQPIYGKPLDVPTVDMLRQSSNQELHSLYQQSDGNQYAAMAHPETARVRAIGDTARQELYPILDAGSNLPAGTTAANQQAYGDLSNVADIANKRDAVFSRHDPVSLAEKIATGHPGGITARALDFVGQKLLRGATDTDALVRSAVDRVQNPGNFTTSLQPRANALPQMTFSAGNAAANLSLPTIPVPAQMGMSIPYPLLVAPAIRPQNQQ